ncbi:hypothetical protein [Halosegnis sp.]|uniref:hypothetical protein n=1 Tax=Halosegnis sp. TaxID=2864959 RepID=UPI0035D46B22
MSEPQSPSDRIVSRTVDGVTTVSRYDLVLAVVPVAFLLAVGGGLLSSVPLHAAMAVGSLVGAAAVADALFVTPPGETGSKSGRREGRRQEPGD